MLIFIIVTSKVTKKCYRTWKITFEITEMLAEVYVFFELCILICFRLIPRFYQKTPNPSLNSDYSTILYIERRLHYMLHLTLTLSFG